MKISLEGKKIRENKVQLRISYSCHGERMYLGTGVVIQRNEWSKKSMERPVLKSNGNSEILNERVSIVLKRLRQIIAELEYKRTSPTVGLVKFYFKNQKEVNPASMESPLMSEVFADFLVKKSAAFTNLKLYRTMISQFNECFPVMRLDEFNEDKWEQFKTHLATARMQSVNTIAIRLNKLKAFLNYLRKRGEDISVTNFQMPKEVRKTIDLKEDEFARILEYEPDSKAMQEIKDLFVFQCFTALRISDLKRFDKSHVQNNEGSYWIKMQAYKSSKFMHIPLHHKATEILTKYDYILPIKAEQYYNRKIKKLIELAGIDREHEWFELDHNGNKTPKKEKLCKIYTNHCCSRTAIKLLFNQGFTPNQVSSMVAKNLQTIMKYYIADASEKEILDKAKQIRWN
jgi:integrase/recombinase XerD